MVGRRAGWMLVALVVAGCGTPASGTSDDGGDASARLACREFRGFAGDADLLTMVELRDRLQAVHDRAEVSETSGIAWNAREMLRAVTVNDADGFEVAVGRFDGACRQIGL